MPAAAAAAAAAAVSLTVVGPLGVAAFPVPLVCAVVAPIPALLAEISGVVVVAEIAVVALVVAGVTELVVAGVVVVEEKEAGVEWIAAGVAVLL